MITTGSSFPHHLVALPGCELAIIEINLSIFSEITHHLMICKKYDFHAMQSGASQYGVEWG